MQLEIKRDYNGAERINLNETGKNINQNKTILKIISIFFFLKLSDTKP